MCIEGGAGNRDANKNRLAIVLVICCAMYCSSAEASIVVDVTQNPQGVTFSSAGSLDFSGLSGPYSAGAVAVIYPQINEMALGAEPTIWKPVNIYFSSPFAIFPDNFSNGQYTYGTSGSGIRWGINNNYLFIDPNYVPGSYFESSLTFANATFTSLGLKEGSYTWAWPADSVTLNVIPLPGALALFGTALVALGAVRTRRGFRTSAKAMTAAV